MNLEPQNEWNELEPLPQVTSTDLNWFKGRSSNVSDLSVSFSLTLDFVTNWINIWLDFN